MKWWRPFRLEPERERTVYRWAELATYNGEVARGIVHTKEWKQKMREEQRLFDCEQRRDRRAQVMT